jgi:hypothetical protein
MKPPPPRCNDDDAQLAEKACARQKSRVRLLCNMRRTPPLLLLALVLLPHLAVAQQGAQLISGSLGGQSYTILINTVKTGADSKSDVTFTYPKPGIWLGLGLGSKMVPGITILGLNAAANPSNPAVGLYQMMAKSTASDMKLQTGLLSAMGITGASFTDAPTGVTLRFTYQQSLAPAGFGLIPKPEAPVPIMLALGRSAALAQHSSYTVKTFSFAASAGVAGNLSLNGTASSLGASVRLVDVALAGHAVIMVMVFVFMLPMGALIALLRKPATPKIWIKLHILFQAGGSVLAVYAAIPGFVLVERNGSPHFSQDHYTLGLFICLACTLQVTNGLMRPHVPAPGEQASRERKGWFWLHRVSAAVIILAGLANCLSGANLFYDWAGAGNLCQFDSSSMMCDKFIVFMLAVAALAYTVVLVAFLAPRLADRLRSHSIRDPKTFFDPRSPPTNTVMQASKE